ncbi:flagellar basal-body rod protein FlgG [Thiomicrorhabdus sp. 6S2-11]|jgi:flagellar basal-body rod protein FlgG|uniref:Flagellar basal-body rod protein FlgG n=1 Tax=Thiomicrorhabdus marina TaxID=2818442 RepID=A0ABS3Q9G2_9GAMM|nr:flagellar basal-body rod protein FlgG [Thiomicrorhabdus marina]MBO1928450.1 flagellar basal-body rod protein FlgG [Thiomicrorhabdus marina]
MNHALYIAKTGLEAQQFRLAAISNNIANANTYGFKAGRAEFNDLIYQNVRQPGAQATQDEANTLPSGLQLGTGVKAIGVQKIHTQGNVMVTDNQLDLMVEGKGFFQVLDQDGNLMYTRDGSFEVNQNGDIVTSSGYLLEPNINIPQDTTEISITNDGAVFVSQPGNVGQNQIGQIELATFINPAGLEALGKNFFAETTASGAPNINNPDTAEAGSVLQGALEASNVNTVEELIGMIEAQRTYEMNSKAISAANGMMQYLNNNT